PEVRPLAHRHRVAMLARNTSKLHQADFWIRQTVLPYLVEYIAPVGQLFRHQRRCFKALIPEPPVKRLKVVFAEFRHLIHVLSFQTPTGPSRSLSGPATLRRWGSGVSHPMPGA